MTAAVGCKFGKKEPLPTRAHPLFARLRAERIRQGITLERLAKKLGYDIYTLGRWERGEQSPTVLHFFDWCDALGIKFELQESHADGA